MLVGNKLDQWEAFIQTASKEELIWMNGYLNGLLQSKPSYTNTSNASITTQHSVQKITIAYGTETGNAKKVAQQLAAAAKKQNILARLIGMDQYKLQDLSKEKHLVAIISTHGEGEPPTAAKAFYDYIHLENAPSLDQLHYCVIGLGDSSYPLFCKAGEEVDARFTALGAKPILPLAKWDTDFENLVDDWIDSFLQSIQSTTIADQPKLVHSASANNNTKPSGKVIYTGIITEHINLNDKSSKKETYHVELSSEQVLDYAPGDAVGIVPKNRIAVVDAIIQLTGIDANKAIETAKHTASVKDLLTLHLNICFLLRNTIQKYAQITGHSIPDTRMDLLDLLKKYPVKNAEQFEEVIKTLSVIAPRLYTISSSPAAHGLNEIHLTIEKHEFTIGEDDHRVGVCSEFIGTQPLGTAIDFYIHKNKSFKLPAQDKDIIMIGPGTGVAPFRSFVSERDAIGAVGKSWLITGGRNFANDFLYQTEWQQFLSIGALNKLNTVFSHDQAETLYVQDRMVQNESELIQWIDKGAHIYVCGNKEKMSVKVEKTLIDIIEKNKNISKEAAVEMLHSLKQAGRYEKDVY